MPLFFSCVAKISGYMSDMVRFIYVRVCCYICIKKRYSTNKVQAQKIMFNNNLNIKNDNCQTLNKSIYENNKNFKSYNSVAQMTDIRDLEKDNDTYSDDKVSVPLTISILILTIYILIGAVWFSQTEEWSAPMNASYPFVISAYFSLITFATIGI